MEISGLKIIFHKISKLLLPNRKLNDISFTKDFHSSILRKSEMFEITKIDCLRKPVSNLDYKIFCIYLCII